MIFLGDYINKGPSSKRVLGFMLTLRRAPPDWCEPIFLMGNHEFVLLELITTRKEFLKHALCHSRFGGGALLKSFGVSSSDKDFVSKLVESMDHGTVDMLGEMLSSYLLGGYAFVHAGLKPGVSFADQSQQDLLWITEPFLSHEEPLGPFVVVHGHSPTGGKPDVRAHRVNVDTGAWRTGRLTAARLLDDEPAAFLSTHPDGPTIL